MTTLAAELRLATCQAENTFAVTREIARYLTEAVDLPVTFIDEIDWRERYRQLASGELQIGWICGWPYTRMAATQGGALSLLAAPVYQGERYAGRPVYFSDVIVDSNSPYRSFPDLRGTVVAYNEVGSQSGYHSVRQHLAKLGWTDGFFARAVASGSHVNSLRMVAAGAADCAAIDSTLLEWLRREQPAMVAPVRVVDTLGPAPIPPWVMHRATPHALAERIRNTLLTLHEQTAGQRLLDQGAIARFVAVDDGDYDPIRAANRAAAAVRLAFDE